MSAGNVTNNDARQRLGIARRAMGFGETEGRDRATFAVARRAVTTRETSD